MRTMRQTDATVARLWSGATSLLPLHFGRAVGATALAQVRSVATEIECAFPAEMERHALWFAVLVARCFRAADRMSIVQMISLPAADDAAARLAGLDMHDAWETASAQFTGPARRMFNKVRRCWQTGFPTRGALLAVMEAPDAYAAGILFESISSPQAARSPAFDGWVQMVRSRLQANHALVVQRGLRSASAVPLFATDFLRALLPGTPPAGPDGTASTVSRTVPFARMTEREIQAVEHWVWTHYEKPRMIQRGSVSRNDFMRGIETFLGRELGRLDRGRVYTEILGLRRTETHRLPLQRLDE